MSDEKVRIRLKRGSIKPIEIGDGKKIYPRKISITRGNKTIEAEKGKILEVSISDLQLWLNTGKFDVIEGTELEESDDDSSEDNTNGGNQ